VDLARRTARLGDTKTGASVRPLSDAACDVLRGMPRIGDGARVFPSTRGAACMSVQEHWLRIARLAGLPTDVTPHVLRHSFMSLGNDLGFTEATIGMICGHKGHSGGTMTRGYIHAGDAVFEAADRIAAATLRKLRGEAAAEVAERPGTHRAAV
jgi:integrase